MSIGIDRLGSGALLLPVGDVIADGVTKESDKAKGGKPYGLYCIKVFLRSGFSWHGIW